MLEKRQFYIDGRWVDALEGTEHLVINPSTGRAFARIALGGKRDTDAAVAAACRAFEGWSQSDVKTRIELLERIAVQYDRHAQSMAQAISAEMGAPIDMALHQQVSAGSSHIRNFIATSRSYPYEKFLGEHAPTERIIYEPIGVCALITPWNWPMNQVTLKVIPALAAGCTMVLKPSENAPLSAMLFSEIVDKAGCPKGVFNLVNGDGAGVGTQLSSHPDVDMVSFTGSTRAGVAISKNAADTIKRVSLELGGKGANIIFSDADAGAVRRGARHCFNNTGQSCNAPTRMLVEATIYPEAVEIARKTAQDTTVGPAHATGKHIGPLSSRLQYEKVIGLINSGIAAGARLVAGGSEKPEGLEEGYFVRPTVLADVSNEMTIAREEIFGPVLSMIPFRDEEEAIRIANDTPYGLTNYVQTGDAERARRVARKLRSGKVEVNGKSFADGSPFGGYKQSGNGRESGVWGLEEFMEVKAVSGW